MSADFVDNSSQLLAAFRDACERGLWRCGEKAEEYAKDLAPVDTGNLRGSITHAEYAEAGGGRPAPWCYQDEQGLWHWTAGNRAHPFIKPSIAGHEKTYFNILKSELDGK